MRKLRFEGCGDDTFGEYGLTGDDVCNCGSMEPVQCIIDCGEFGRLMVVGQYSKASCGNGCWMIGVSKAGEFEDLPNWDMTFRRAVGAEYSVALEIILPLGDFNLQWFKNGVEVDS